LATRSPDVSALHSGHPSPRFARERWLSLDGPWPTVEADRTTYRRTLHIPDDWERTLLHFGAVDWRAEVFLDGAAVGSHEGGYTHFAVDLGRLRAGSEHELLVEVFDPADDAFGQPKGKQRGSHDIWYTRVTGAWGSVWIESVPDEYMRSASDAEITIGLPDDEPELWSPDNPRLYDVEYRLGGDRVTSYVGYRTIEARGRELFLNGEPLRIAGVLDQGFWPDGIYSATDAQLRADVEAAKALGFNLARKHVKVEDPRWYSWCDRLGLLVAQDMPSSHDLSTPEAEARFEREWTEILAQLAGHPSIVMWIPINEDWGEPTPGFQRELVDLTHSAVDGLVVDASGWKQQLDHTDVIDVHDYGATLVEHVKHADAQIPVWIGECGGISLGDSDFVYRDVDDLAGAYRGLIEQIPSDVAGFVWTQLTDVEGERNGLLTYDRRPKCDVDALRTVNEEFRNG
jgi:beta-galactosidase/beta-glucuronidase